MAYEQGLAPFSLHLLRPFSHSMKMAKRSGPQVSDDKAPFFLVALSVVLFFPLRPSSSSFPSGLASWGSRGGSLPTLAKNTLPEGPNKRG